MAFLRRQLPPQKLRQAGGVKDNLLSTLSKWFKAQCILLAVTFSELLVGLLLIRQPYALLLAAVIAFIDALPVFGTGTVLLPWAAVCLLLQQTPKAIAGRAVCCDHAGAELFGAEDHGGAGKSAASGGAIGHVCRLLLLWSSGDDPLPHCIAVSQAASGCRLPEPVEVISISSSNMPAISPAGFLFPRQ